MPSLNDIPNHLRNAPNKVAFMEWLVKVPAHFNHKRSIAHLWTRETQIPLTGGDFTLLRNTALPLKK